MAEGSPGLDDVRNRRLRAFVTSCGRTVGMVRFLFGVHIGHHRCDCIFAG